MFDDNILFYTFHSVLIFRLECHQMKIDIFGKI